MTRPLADIIAALHRQHYREILAPLIRSLGSFEWAEDVVQEAFVQALRSWEPDRLPDEPVAWLRRVARNRAIDQYRRRQRGRSKEQDFAAALPDHVEPRFDDDAVADDDLRLIFTCCHPSLAPEAQIALTLRTVCGLTTEQVARAFLVKATTPQQRIVRAKRKIDRAGIPYVVPDRDALPQRLPPVLKTVYLVFNEGYGATDGESLIRRELCDEGIRLGRLLCGLMPGEPAPQALLALMLLQHSRHRARTDAHGDLVPLEEQDRGLWDQTLIAEALPLVEASLAGQPVPAYAIEAAIAAVHAQAGTPEATDWAQIAALYGLLEQGAVGNPVVALNAAVAVAMAGDLAAGLARIEALDRTGRLAGYHLLPAARADLLRRLGRPEEARNAFRQALEMTTNPVERRFIERRLAALAAPGGDDRP